MTVTDVQRAKAIQFGAMHTSGKILVLPNAWDGSSAVVFERAGFAAIGTTSAGIAFSLGYPDGERMPRALMLASVRSITRPVSLPVSADLESGYAVTLVELADTVRAVIAAGAIGVNVEDSRPVDEQLIDVTSMAAKIRRVREVAHTEKLPLVVNARVDVFLKNIGDPAERFGHAVRRANTYREAGADCVFVPGVTDHEAIARLVAAIDAPLNIMATPGCPSTDELQRLGVARVSLGAGPMRATRVLLQRIASELAERGTYRTFHENWLSRPECNQLFGA